MKKLRETTNTSLAGEYYVAAQLLRLNLVVLQTIGPHKEIDWAVIRPNGKKVTIDVKAQRANSNWPLKVKNIRPDHFYALVRYKNPIENLDVPPEVFIIPSSKIPKFVTHWTGRPEVTCVGYNRKLRDSSYKNAWRLIAGKR